jgi:hypothetical protein
MRFVFESEVALDHALSAAPAAPTAEIDHASEPVLEWLGRLRLLQGVPFEYLVPDDGLLRPETMRFFYVDRNWTDAAVDGALATGAYSTRDRLQLQQRHAAVRDAVDAEERRQRVGPAVTSTGPATITGFLLRSRAVSGWPGMHVRGFRTSGTTERQLAVLRMERLSPAVLLVLFDDIPDRMEIEEPRQGIQFGVRAPRVAAEPAGTWWLDVRRPSTGEEVHGAKVRVPFRAGSAGVIHLAGLRRRLTTDHASIVGSTLTPAEMALQLLRYPYRQHFGRTTKSFDDLLVTGHSVATVSEWMRVADE